MHQLLLPATPARWLLRLLAVTAVGLGLVLAVTGPGRGQAPGAVHLVTIDGEIDLGLAPFLDRVVGEAAEAEAAAVVLVIDTPGGRLDAVLQMRDTLLDARVPTVALIDRTALSAGALIALASEQIHVVPGAVVGAATPVTGDGVEASEKVVSAVRSTFRSTAEQRGRDPLVAEAMVDASIAIEDVVARGELLTLTYREALELGIADGLVDDLDGLLEELGLADAEQVTAQISWAERLARAVTNGLVASLLLSLGVLFLVGDLLNGGAGLGVLVGGGMLAAYFGGHLIAGLAGWEDVALLVIGLVLLLLELLVIPGVGVAGVLGLASVLGAGFLATLNRDLRFVGAGEVLRSSVIVGGALVLIVAGVIGLMLLLVRGRGPRGLVLATSLGDGTPVTERGGSTGWLGWFDGDAVLASDREEPPIDGDGPPPPRHLPPPDARPGATGTAVTDLRPAGVADIAGRRVDVITEGEFVAAGTPIEVVVDEGYRRVVRRRPT